jgi:hypothetical protein
MCDSVIIDSKQSMVDPNLTYDAYRMDTQDPRAAMRQHYSNMLDLIEVKRKTGKNMRAPVVRKFRNIASARTAFEIWAKEVIHEHILISEKWNKEDPHPTGGDMGVVTTMFCELGTVTRDQRRCVSVSKEEWQSIKNTCDENGGLYKFAKEKGYTASASVLTENLSRVVMFTLLLERV